MRFWALAPAGLIWETERPISTFQLLLGQLDIAGAAVAVLTATALPRCAPGECRLDPVRLDRQPDAAAAVGRSRVSRSL